MSAATEPVPRDLAIIAAKLEWARAYIAAGCRVGVLHYPNLNTGRCSCGEDCGKNAAKHPLTRVMGGGLTRFTRDPSTAERWLNQEPNANISIEPPPGYAFFDVDDLAAMQADGRTWPATLQECTGRGGLHLLYRSRVAGIVNSVKLLPYLDVRGPGSYIVATPSMHILGVEYGPWEPAFDLDAVADAPEWIEELLAAKVAENNKVKDTTAPTFTWRRDAEVPAKLEALLDGDQRARLTWNQQRDLPSPSEYDLALANVFVRAGWSDQEVVDALTARRREWGHELKRASYYATTVAKARTANPASASEAWPPRQPLPAAEPVPTLPPEFLPGPLQGWLVDAADCASIPLEMVVAPTLVVISSLVGHSLGIRPEGARNPSFFVIPNLWGAIVAPPGLLKTHALGEATAPLRPLEDDAARENTRAKEAAEIEKMALQAELNKLKTGTKGHVDRVAIASTVKALRECDPPEKRYSTSDTTIEKLGEILIRNPRGILIRRDELGGWLTSFKRAGHESDRDFFLDSWRGSVLHGRPHRSWDAPHPGVVYFRAGRNPARSPRSVRDRSAGRGGRGGWPTATFPTVRLAGRIASVPHDRGHPQSPSPRACLRTLSSA